MTPIQLDIIKAFGSKELSEGCILNNFWEIIKLKKDYKIIQNNESEKDILIFGKNDDELSLNHNTEILWHIPELFPDVARVTKEKGIQIWIKYLEPSFFVTDAQTCVITVWDWIDSYWEIPYNPTLSFIDQDEQLTLIPLLSLIKN